MENVSVLDVFSILFTGINAVFDWFQTYILVGNWSYLIYGIIFFFMFSRLILAPLFGAFFSGGYSDTVSRVESELKEDAVTRMGKTMSPYDERWLM